MGSRLRKWLLKHYLYTHPVSTCTSEVGFPPGRAISAFTSARIRSSVLGSADLGLNILFRVFVCFSYLGWFVCFVFFGVLAFSCLFSVIACKDSSLRWTIMYQTRRITLLTHSLTCTCICRPSRDPAASNDELRKRLVENRKTGRKRLDEVCHVLSFCCGYSLTFATSEQLRNRLKCSPTSPICT